MNMPRVKNEVSIGSIVSWVSILLTVVGLGAAIGSAQSDIASLKSSQAQSNADSRALIRLQSDMDYLKMAIDELRKR